jgi:hypothetical protein
MPDLLIKDAELQQLDKLIQEVPTKHGFGIVVFFQQVRALRDKEAQAEGSKVKESVNAPEKQEGTKEIPQDVIDN